jgi:putative ABC transport system substrate-binding protein
VKRREFITLLGGATAGWPLAAPAQQPTMPVIGFLNSAAPDPFAHLVRAFHQGLSESGYVEGRNVAIEYRWAEGNYDRLPAMAADLVRRQVAVIVAAGGSPPARAAMAATATIPIVFQTGVDPVEAGFAASLNRPGGNLTGITTLTGEVGPKRLELLNEIVPKASIGLLLNPGLPSAETNTRILQAAAGKLGVPVHVLNARTERDFDTVFAAASRLGVGGLFIHPDPFLNSQSQQLAMLTVRHALPAIFHVREFTAAGGLMSYGGSNTDAYRHVGIYAGRILKGEKPADLPVHQVTKVELIINLKTAKALGLTVPLSLLGRADEVIE